MLSQFRIARFSYVSLFSYLHAPTDFTRTCCLLWGFLRQIKLLWQNILKISKDVHVLHCHDMATIWYKVSFYFCQGVGDYRFTSMIPCLKCSFPTASPFFLWKFSDALRCSSMTQSQPSSVWCGIWPLLDVDPSLTECSFHGGSRTLV